METGRQRQRREMICSSEGEVFRGTWRVEAGNDFCVYDHIYFSMYMKFPKNKKLKKNKTSKHGPGLDEKYSNKFI